MVRTGQQFICDACKKTVFISTELVPRDDGKYYPKTWEKKNGMDLCEGCATDFERWLDYRATHAIAND